MAEKSQAKNKCETLKCYPRNLWKNGDSRRLFFFHLLSYPLLCSQW